MVIVMQKHKLVIERGLGLRSEDQGPSFGHSHSVIQNNKNCGGGARFTGTSPVCEILFVMGTTL